ncbi:MAG: hypothetical protein H8D55_02715 [Deltaproteobacteria bacterium]|nr:hypothetical protein [Deltaproteobacteria bacterium]
MDHRELEVSLEDIESYCMEHKASIAERNKIRQADCAFANDLPNYRQPGVVFIGVHMKIVQSSYTDFQRIAKEIADLTGSTVS